MNQQLLNPLRLSAAMATHALHRLLVVRTFSETQVLLVVQELGCGAVVTTAQDRVDVSVNLFCQNVLLKEASRIERQVKRFYVLLVGYAQLEVILVVKVRYVVSH